MCNRTWSSRPLERPILFKDSRTLDSETARVSAVFAQIPIFEIVNDRVMDGNMIKVYCTAITEIGIVPNAAV
jgi:hypothetical protein